MRTLDRAIEWIARGGLACLAIAALILAAGENHEAVGTALVGAATAFGLAAAFFERVIEVSARGVRLADLRALEEAAAREAPDASPEEKEELIAKSSEQLADKRSAGESITPDLALKEVKLSWQRNGLAAEIRFANWLIERGWMVSSAPAGEWHAQPDLIAERGDRLILVEVKAGNRVWGVDAVRRALTLQPPRVTQRARDLKLERVLVLGEAGLTRHATEFAMQSGLSVYRLEIDNEVSRILGPELD